MTIYCKNCRYYEYMSWIPNPRLLIPPNHMCKKLSIPQYTGVGELTYSIVIDANIQNKNHDCKYYKKLWYKF